MHGHTGGTPTLGTARPRRVWAMLALATAVGAVLVSPYLTLDIDNSRLEVSGVLHYSVLVVHIFTALVALVLGPLQFIPAIRVHRRRHRRIGRTYLLAGVLPSALAAIPVALLSGRPLTQIGLTVPAVGWLVTGWLAVQAARRRDFEAHRAWMMRNYALTFLAVTSRIVTPLLLLAHVPFRDSVQSGSLGEAAQDVIPIGQTLGWIINLIVVELLIRRRRERTTKSLNQ